MSTTTPLSWKKYGAKTIAPNGKYDNLVVNRLSLLTGYVGNFTVCGSLVVDGEFTVTGISTISGDTVVDNSLFVRDSIYATNLNLSGDLTVSGSSTLIGPTTVGAGGQFFRGDVSGIIVNRSSGPDSNATLEINGSRPESLAVYSSAATNRNILAQNVSGNGVVVSTSPSETMVEMYHGANQNVAADLPDVSGAGPSVGARISYSGAGTVSGDDRLSMTASNLSLVGRTTVVNRDQATFPRPTLVARTRDLSSNIAANQPYLPGTSTNVSGTYTGIGATVAGPDVNANAFFAATNSTGTAGFLYGGGQAPGRTPGTSMGTLGVHIPGKGAFVGGTVQPLYVPLLSAVQGSRTSKIRGTVGVNTSDPVYDDLALDVNGPTRIRHTEIVPSNLNVPISFGNSTMSFSPVNPNRGILVGPRIQGTSGSYYAYYTTDGGASWTETTIGDSNTASVTFNGFFVDGTTAIAVAANNSTYISTNGGQTWTAQNMILPTITNTFVHVYVTGTSLYYTNVSGVYLNTGYTTGGTGSLLASLPFVIGAMHGNPDGGGTQYLYVCGTNGNIWTRVGTVATTYQSSTVATYTAARCYRGTTCVAAGNTLAGAVMISYTVNGGTTWTDATFDVPHFNLTPRAICVVDAVRAIVVCTGGLILYSVDGFHTWKYVLPTDIGTESYLLLDANTDLVGVSGMGSDAHSFVIAGTRTIPSPRTLTFILSIPTLMDDTAVLLRVDGSQRVRKHLTVDLGVSVGTNLAVGGNTTVSGTFSSGAATISGDTSITGNLVVSGLNLSLVGSPGGTTTISGTSTTISGNSSLRLFGATTTISATSLSLVGTTIDIGTNTPGGKSITIGTVGDTITIQGNLVIVNNPVVTQQTIVLNSGNSAPNSAKNVGITMFESGNPTAGFLLTSDDRRGFKFKAPASATTVKFDVSGLKQNGSGSSAIMVLVPGTDTGTGSTFDVTSGSIDSTNLMLRNGAQSSASSQVITTDMSVFGNTTLSGSVLQFTGGTLSLSGEAVTVSGSGASGLTLFGDTVTISNGGVGKFVNINGNARFSGTICGGSISGTSLSVTGNVSTASISGGTLSTTGLATVTGLTVSGTQQLTVSNGNLVTLGNVSAASISGGTLSTTGLARVTGLTVSGTQQLTVSNGNLVTLGNVSATSISGGTLSTTGLAMVTGLTVSGTQQLTVSNGNLVTLGNVSAASISGGTFSTTGLATVNGLTVSGTQQLTVSNGNLVTLGNVSAASISGGALSTSGLATVNGLTVSGTQQLTVSNGNLVTLGNVSAASISGGTLSTAGLATVTGLTVSGTQQLTVSNGNLVTLGNVSAASISGGTFSTTGLATVTGLTVSGTQQLTVSNGNLATLGNVSAASISGGTLSTTGLVTVNGLTVSGTQQLTVSNGNLVTLGNVSAASIGGGTLSTTGLATVTGLTVSGTQQLTVSNGNLVTLGNVSAASISGGTLSTTGLATVNGLTVSGTQQLTVSNGNLVTLGNVSAASISGGTLSTTGLATVNGLTVSGTQQLTVSNGNLVTLGNVSAASISGGTLSTTGLARVTGLTVSGTQQLTVSNGNLVTLGNVSAASISGGTLSTTGLATVNGLTVAGALIKTGGVTPVTDQEFSYLAGLTAPIVTSLSQKAGLTNNILGISNIGTNPYPWYAHPTVFGAIAGNMTSGHVEVDFVNSGSATFGQGISAFDWYLMTSSTAKTLLMRLFMGGNLAVAGNITSPTVTDLSNATVANAASIVTVADRVTVLETGSRPYRGTTAVTGNITFTAANFPSVITAAAVTAVIGIPAMPVGTEFTAVRTGTTVISLTTNVSGVLFNNDGATTSWVNNTTLTNQSQSFLRTTIGTVECWVRTSSYTPTIIDKAIAGNCGAVMINGDALGSGGAHYSLYCSNPVFVPTDVDDAYIVNPGYSIQTYEGYNYNQLIATYDNTTGSLPTMFVAGVDKNRMASYKLYYRGVERFVANFS